MKKFRTIVSAMLVLAFVLAAIPAFAAKGVPAEPTDVSGNTFTNEYITFTVNSNGCVSNMYSMENGSQADRLLFGGSTSYTTIRVNGTSYQYRYVDKTVDPAFQGNTNYSAANVDGILVEQRLTPVNNDLGEESIIEWHYTYTNTTDSVQNVGCRIMLDTMLGSNDGAPYRLPGIDSITTEMTVYPPEISTYWFTYYEDIVAQGSFDAYNMPDMYQIAAWADIVYTPWDYVTTVNGSFYSDSSCAATWFEEPLQPGETREYVEYYGLGEVSQQQVGELQLTLNGNHSVAINAEGNGYEPNPVSLMGILKNVGNAGLEGVYAYVVLPEGLSFAEGTEGIFMVGDLAAGAEGQNTWFIAIDETSTQDRTFTIEVHYGCDGQEEAVAYFELFVPGIAAEETVPPTIAVERAELRTRNTEDGRADLRFIFNVTFNDGFVNHVGVTYGPGAAYEITDFYSVVSVLGNTATVPGRKIFEMYDNNYFFTAVVKGIRPEYFGTRVNATGYLEYVEVATGIAGADDTTDQLFSFCINDLL